MQKPKERSKSEWSFGILPEVATEVKIREVGPRDGFQNEPEVMAAALRALPRQKLPSQVVVPGLLEGLPNVAKLVEPWLQPAESEAEDISAKVMRIG